MVESLNYKITQTYRSHNSNIDLEFNIEKITNNKNIISIGKCSRFYLYILGAGSFKLLSLLILGENRFYEDGIGLFGFCPVLYKYNFIQSTYMYLGYIIFGIIFLRFKGVNTLYYKKEDDNDSLINRDLTLGEHYKIKLAKNIEKDIKREIFFLSLTIVIQIETKKVLYIEGFQFFNFWVIEIIFMQILMRKYFTIDVYIHHKISIIFNVTVASAILLTASFLPTSLSNDNPGNSYQNTKSKFGSYFYCILIILFFVFLSFLFCFTRIYSKVLMQFKFVSPYKLIIFFGIVGFVISIACSLIAYNINYQDNLFNYFSSMKSSLDEGKKYKYYGEIFLVYPFYAFANFMEFSFEILTIYYLNPFFMLMSNNLYYGITAFLYFVLNSSNDTLVILHFILTELAEILTAFGYLVYLEIIEFHCCGLGDNLRKIISKKGEEEFRTISLTEIPLEENETIDENEEIDNNNNDNINNNNQSSI